MIAVGTVLLLVIGLAVFGVWLVQRLAGITRDAKVRLYAERDQGSRTGSSRAG